MENRHQEGGILICHFILGASDNFMDADRIFESLWRPLQARRLQRVPRRHVLGEANGNDLCEYTHYGL